MSATATIQAVAVLVDLMTAATHMMAQSQRIAGMLNASGGTLTDDQWRDLQDEDAILAAALATAISERRKRQNASGQ